MRDIVIPPLAGNCISERRVVELEIVVHVSVQTDSESK